MAEELGRELESLVRLELGLLGLKRRSALRMISEQSFFSLIYEYDVPPEKT